LVDNTCFHSLNSAIQALSKAIPTRIWLIILCDFLIPNFMKLFQWSLKRISWKGLSCKHGALSKFRFSSIAYIWLWHLQHHLVCLVWAQTHCLTKDKHLGCYNPPPLKESDLEIQGERLSKEEKRVIHVPTFLILVLHGRFCLKNFLHWLS
jgi:hypothetical protein